MTASHCWLGHFAKLAVAGDAGAIHQNIHWANRRFDFLNHQRHGIKIADVAERNTDIAEPKRFAWSEATQAGCQERRNSPLHDDHLVRAIGKSLYQFHPRRP